MDIARSLRFQARGGAGCRRISAVFGKGNRTTRGMKRYIVTGGAGFIGSTLVRQLLAHADAQVEVIDNLLTGHAGNLAEVRPRIGFHSLDIRDYDGVARAVNGADVVFHLAAIPSVPRS